ncbi:MAG: hypothetical protein FWE09_02340 [Treponema sp.]|nr:hypothetical protein [Treponema sp.]
MAKKIMRATVYPPGGETIKYEVGRSGVTKIELQVNWWWGFTEGLKVVFDDGSQRVYRSVPFSLDVEGKGRRA